VGKGNMNLPCLASSLLWLCSIRRDKKIERKKKATSAPACEMAKLENVVFGL